MKRVYTTGAVAKLLGININTVIKWFDDGKLDGFRLPTSNERRIPIESLRRFMATHSIPLSLLDDNGSSRRTHERMTCKDPILFHVADGQVYGPYRGSLADLSEGGAGIRAQGPDALSLPMHPSTIRLEIAKGPLAATNLTGKIVYVRPGEDKLAIGMQFSDLAEIDKQRLHDHLFQQLG